MSPQTISKLNIQSVKRNVEHTGNSLFIDLSSQSIIQIGYKFFNTIVTILNIILEFQSEQETLKMLPSYLEIIKYYPQQSDQNIRQYSQ